jgi:hypothetical protein
MFVYYELASNSLNIQPFVGPNMDRAKIEAVLKPLFDKLRADGVQYSTQTREFGTFFDMYTAMFQDESAGFSGLVGGRLFTKKDIESNGDGIVRAYRTATSSAGGGFSVIIGHIVGEFQSFFSSFYRGYPSYRRFLLPLRIELCPGLKFRCHLFFRQSVSVAQRGGAEERNQIQQIGQPHKSLFLNPG